MLATARLFDSQDLKNFGLKESVPGHWWEATAVIEAARKSYSSKR